MSHLQPGRRFLRHRPRSMSICIIYFVSDSSGSSCQPAIFGIRFSFDPRDLTAILQRSAARLIVWQLSDRETFKPHGSYYRYVSSMYLYIFFILYTLLIFTACTDQYTDMYKYNERDTRWTLYWYFGDFKDLMLKNIISPGITDEINSSTTLNISQSHFEPSEANANGLRIFNVSYAVIRIYQDTFGKQHAMLPILNKYTIYNLLFCRYKFLLQLHSAAIFLASLSHSYWRSPLFPSLAYECEISHSGWAFTRTLYHLVEVRKRSTYKWYVYIYVHEHYISTLLRAREDITRVRCVCSRFHRRVRASLAPLPVLTVNSNLQLHLSANLELSVCLRMENKCRRMRRELAIPLVAQLSQKVNKASSQTCLAWKFQPPELLEVVTVAVVWQ